MKISTKQKIKTESYASKQTHMKLNELKQLELALTKSHRKLFKRQIRQKNKQKQKKNKTENKTENKTKKCQKWRVGEWKRNAQIVRIKASLIFYCCCCSSVIIYCELLCTKRMKNLANCTQTHKQHWNNQK